MKGNTAAVAALYAEDAEAFPAGSDLVKGRPRIEQMWKSVADSCVTSAEFTTTRVDEAGTYAIETGAYVMKRKDGSVEDRGVIVPAEIHDFLLYRSCLLSGNGPGSRSRG